MVKTEKGFFLVYLLRKVFAEGEREISLQNLVRISGLKYSTVWKRVYNWQKDGYLRSINPEHRYKNIKAQDLRKRHQVVIGLTGKKGLLRELFLLMWTAEWEAEASRRYKNI